MTGLAGMAAVVVLTALRMPVALSLLLAAVAGLAMSGSLDAVRAPVTDLLSSPDLPLVPLVLLLGNLAFYAGFATRVHDAAAVLLQGRRGGLAIAAILGGAGFAATSGSSTGCAATLSRIALPAMERAGHDERLAGASVAMGSTLGALLPPSMLLIVWGLLSDISVGTLFLAGLVPALLSLAGMTAVVLWWVWRDPAAAPIPPRMDIPVAAAIRAVWPAPVLFVVVVGGLSLGLLSASAAIALCLAATLLFGLLQRRLTPETLWLALRDALHQTALVILTLIAARLFLAFLAAEGTLALIADGLSAMPLLVAVALLGLGCAALALLVEPMAMVVLALPFALALAGLHGLDPVWAGIVLVKLVEIAMVLPPLGLVVIIVARASGSIAAGAIFAGVWRFLFVDLLVLAALVLFPALAVAVGV